MASPCVGKPGVPELNKNDGDAADDNDHDDDDDNNSDNNNDNNDTNTLTTIVIRRLHALPNAHWQLHTHVLVHFPSASRTPRTHLNSIRMRCLHFQRRRFRI